MPHPCSAEGDRVRRIIIGGGMCVGKRTVTNPVYYNGDMQKREGAAMALPSMGMVPHQATS